MEIDHRIILETVWVIFSNAEWNFQQKLKNAELGPHLKKKIFAVKLFLFLKRILLLILKYMIILQEGCYCVLIY